MAVDFLNDAIKVTIENRVAMIEMNQSDALNRLNKDNIKELIHILKEISISDEIKIVVLTGKEGAFSASVDTQVLSQLKNESDFYYTMNLINELISVLYSMPKITISAISGRVSGLGISLALATDHILASKHSIFVMNSIEMGLIPVGGLHFFLERRLGEDRAKHLIWAGKTMSAEEAIQHSLINEIAEGSVQQAIGEKVQQWLQTPIQAMIKSKKILAEKNRPHLLKILELEKFAQYKMRQTKDHQECCQAAMEKRKPNFVGE
ncbi:enoyl-CoA hydratase/isomerase family protein [Bacillus sp. V3B]|uniref:enoyl-CoA hydratase-related protein n=1 Tax=Bacillus sp. V3B TaxID=2804915 RepID=UPI002108E9A9|nr:enoyl-CoA hydratase-related protein [Bacillus sp. V3B]MCQ6273386.1 enoyl-CoA hydratase/isomerase family protein [Bacillus sp. V3B]